ncbi:methyl-accepting chemotaxis protein [Rhodoferax sp.]|uniref:methyl-accepting chemotaxis protein n=1 Tax=Rhodoferax sp. TaxID=50421 RepID=UPI0025D654CF|nr:methyl-accepting chemotaxis protein [Rhodoferax sp.]
MRENGPVSQKEFILPAAKTLVSVTDLKGRIVYCNHAFVAASGFAEAELLGQAHNMIRHPDMPAEAFRDMWATIQGGKPWSAMVKNRRKDGDHYWVKAHVTPTRKDGQMVGYISVRTVPERSQVDAAEQLYARMREEAALGRLHTVLRSGRVQRAGWLGRASQGLRAALGAYGVVGLIHLGTLLLVAAAAMLLPPVMALGLLAVAAVGGYALQWYAMQRPVRRAQSIIENLASGDLVTQLEGTQGGDFDGIYAGLQQLRVTVQTLLTDSRNVVLELRGVGEEVASGSMDMSARTESQASSIEETAAAMEQINGTASNTAAAAAQGTEYGKTAQDTARLSEEAVANMVSTMEAISESSRKIGDIIQVIEGVAFQTNILALNAAVEAARAGEQGRGFAVVASEVRTLAQRTSAAAKEIRQLIGESTQRVDAGNAVTAEAQSRMRDLAEAVSNMQNVLEQVSHAAGEQQLGVSQVSDAITQLDTTTQQNAAMVEELAAASQGIFGPIESFDLQLSLFQLSPGQRVVAERDVASLKQRASSAVSTGTDFDVRTFTEAHLKWKTRLRNAIRDGEKFDVATVRRDDCCALGKWVHSTGQARWAQLPGFTKLLNSHAQFHRSAAPIAEAANHGDADRVKKLLASGSDFSKATQSTVMAIRSLDTEIRQTVGKSKGSSARVGGGTAPASNPVALPAPSAPHSEPSQEWETF